MASASAVGVTPRPATSWSIQYPTLAVLADPQTMLPTVSWPANRPSKRITHGSVTPRRASLRIVLTIAMYGPRLVWYNGVSGLVGSQGRSHSALRTRASRHDRASLAPSGRSATGAPSSTGSVSVAGQPVAYTTTPSLRVRARARHLDTAERESG